MNIEQLPPNKPNFLLILYVFCGALVVIFVFALIFLHWDGKHLTFRHTHTQPTSYLSAPALSRTIAA
jgi:NADH:ubiquinone oxidoreductase subunit 6 (subunit J)